MRLVKMTFSFVLISFVLAFLANAQHGTSPEGVDTWDGRISAVDADKGEITLAALKNKSSEKFVLPVEDVKPGGQPHGLQLADLAVGQTVHVTYIKTSYSENGRKISRNMVLTIEIVEPSKRS